MIIAQMLMLVLTVAVVYTVGKQLYQDIKADVKKRWLFNVGELSFCKHIWSSHYNGNQLARLVPGSFDFFETRCINSTSAGVVCGRVKCEVKRGEV